MEGPKAGKVKRPNEVPDQSIKPSPFQIGLRRPDDQRSGGVAVYFPQSELLNGSGWGRSPVGQLGRLPTAGD